LDQTATAFTFGSSCPEVFIGDRRLVQHFDMALMHHLRLVAQLGAFPPGRT
jgi:hypothetical protein